MLALVWMTTFAASAFVVLKEEVDDGRVLHERSRRLAGGTP